MAQRQTYVLRDVALCAQCPARYIPEPDEAVVLSTVESLHHWACVITRYALRAGWRRRPDEALVCPAHTLSPQTH